MRHNRRMTAQSDLDRLRRGMELLSKAVAEEILRYPAPIPACDEQFNHLLDLRRMLPAELTRLEAARETGSVTAAEFIQTSPCRETLAALLQPAR